MQKTAKQRKRGTLLLMVVGLLATLFLIVSAYITVAQFDSLAMRSAGQRDAVDQILKSIDQMVLANVMQSWVDGEGSVLAGGRRDPSSTTSAAVLKTYSPEDRLGSRGTRWLAGPEPVRDRALDAYLVGLTSAGARSEMRVYRQTVSIMDGSYLESSDTRQSNQVPLVGASGQTPDWHDTQARVGLMLENPSDQDADFDLIYGSDVRSNVLRPFMDADGDGIADSSFAGTAALTEIANAVGGVAVRAPGGALDPYGFGVSTGFNPSAVGDSGSDLMAAMFSRFDERARYEVAAKIISHGGLVALASPGNHVSGSVWNREFVTEMFNWVRKRQYEDYSSSWGDERLGYVATGWQDPNRWFNELHASAGAVEPFFRYRGGLMANHAEATGAATGLPTVLQGLRDAFPFTFDLTQQVVGVSSRTDPTQRFNLATLYDPFVTSLQSDWFLWRAGATMDPNEYLNQTSYNPRAYYVRRQLLTTISNSDELAREIDPQSPNPALPQTNIGLYPGQLKFYLGDVARAFNVNGQYMSQVLPDGKSRGNIVVRRLADFFYEMLADTQGWKNLADETEVLTRRQQACMLAVNTVAFAAPRSNTGFIDAVWLEDFNGIEVVKYVGYAPQPFITQVIAYGEEGDTTSKKIGVAVELFYPHDPGPDWNPLTADKLDENDPFALDLSQFYISVTERHATGLPGAGEEPTSTALRLSEAVGAQPMTRLVGRNFLALTLDNGWTDSPLRGFVGVDGHLNTLAPIGTTPHGGRDVIEVKLWRQDSQNGLHLIDKLVVGDLQEAQIPSRPDGFGGGGLGEEEDEDFKWLVDYYRDTGLEPVFGGDWNDDGFVDTPARWRMVMNTRGAHAEDNDGGFTVSVSTRMEKIGQPGPVPSTSADEHFAPTVPLYTMNAGNTQNNPASWSLTARPLPRGFFTEQPIHGSYRPKSFPTVGFMLFVPRYAHTSSKPMSEVLAEQWAKWDGEVDLGDDSSYYEYDTSSEDPSGGTGGFGGGGRPTVRVNRGLYPADFGHMPVFDNNQDVRNSSYFDLDPAAGTRPAIPWGQLVFDYFTTLDPNADYDGDGLPDVDPWRVPGRININTAPWYVIAGLPLVHPMYLNDGSSSPASPAFWSPKSGVLVGDVDYFMRGAHDRLYRFEEPAGSGLADSPYSLLWYDQENGWYRLGPELALAIVSYRDRLRYVSDNVAESYDAYGNPVWPLWLAEYRNRTVDHSGFALAREVQAASRYRNEDQIVMAGFPDGYPYGPIRRGGQNYEAGPAKYERGFLTLGELANVKGFDSSVPDPAYPGDCRQMLYTTLGPGQAVVGLKPDRPDFFKAVSLMALLDTHFLVTRSNTFTVYTTLNDRDPERPHGSIRTQYTVDRSNLLPRLVMQDTDDDGFADTPLVESEVPVVIQGTGQPEVLSRRQVGYYDTRFDQ
jgi:hypothetical protein